VPAMDTNPRPVFEPLLPPELERTIFEVAALGQPSTIPVLMLVASRVKEWPMLGFPQITLEILLRVIATKPPQFLQKSVKHFFLDAPLDSLELETIFMACNRITNLFDPLPSTAHWRALGALKHLQRVALPLDVFLECYHIDNTQSLLVNITHLELLETRRNPRIDNLCACLPLMPRLTHIALDSISLHWRLQTALCENTKIQCILFLVSLGDAEEMQSTNVLLDDTRFACLDQKTSFREDWLCGAARGENYWAIADAFIAARRDGKVDRSRYTLSDKETSWLD